MKRTPEGILDKLIEEFDDRSGCSEMTYVHEILTDAQSNAFHDGGVTDEQLDILDSTLDEVSKVAQEARKRLEKLRGSR